MPVDLEADLGLRRDAADDAGVERVRNALRQDADAAELERRIKNAHAYGIARGRVMQLKDQVGAIMPVAQGLARDLHFMAVPAELAMLDAARLLEQAVRKIETAQLETKPQQKEG